MTSWTEIQFPIRNNALLCFAFTTAVMDRSLFSTKFYNTTSLNTDFALQKSNAEKNLLDKISENRQIKLRGFFRVAFSPNSNCYFQDCVKIIRQQERDSIVISCNQNLLNGYNNFLILVYLEIFVVKKWLINSVQRFFVLENWSGSSEQLFDKKKNLIKSKICIFYMILFKYTTCESQVHSISALNKLFGNRHSHQTAY